LLLLQSDGVQLVGRALPRLRNFNTAEMLHSQPWDTKSDVWGAHDVSGARSVVVGNKSDDRRRRPAETTQLPCD
jgi:hypothetical protein